MSKERKRTPSFAMDPTIKEEQPLYKARGPSLRKTSATTRKGFRGLAAFFELWSWTLVFANSKGYVTAASMPPAMPPETRDTTGGVLESLAVPGLELIRSCFVCSQTWVLGSAFYIYTDMIELSLKASI